MAAANLASMHQYWKTFDLPQIQRELDSAATELANRQDESDSSRKRLVEQSREFKKNTPEEIRKTVAPLLKSFQIEVDHLSKRSKTAEAAFLAVYKKLIDVPDPAPVLEHAMQLQKKMQRAQDLEVENQKLRETLDEYNHEFAEVKNQEVTIKTLKEKLKEYEEKMEVVAQSRAKEKEKDLQREFAEKERQLQETQLAVATKLGEAEHKVATLQSALDSTQSELFDLKAKYDEQTAAKSDEMEMIMTDLERANQRAASAEKEIESMKVQLLSANEALRQAEQMQKAPNMEQAIDILTRSSLEVELSAKEKEISQLVDDIQRLQATNAKLRDSTSSQVTKLEEQLAQKSTAFKRLEERMKSQSDYDEMKKELNIMKSMEFHQVEEDDSNQQKSLEMLLLEKNRALQSENTSLKLSNTELNSEGASLTTHQQPRTCHARGSPSGSNSPCELSNTNSASPNTSQASSPLPAMPRPAMVSSPLPSLPQPAKTTTPQPVMMTTPQTATKTTSQPVTMTTSQSASMTSSPVAMITTSQSAMMTSQSVMMTASQSTMMPSSQSAMMSSSQSAMMAASPSTIMSNPLIRPNSYPAIRKHYVDNGDINTIEVARIIKDLLLTYNIGQRVFGEYVLAMSQGSVSEILARPKPWDKLTVKGREPFIKMVDFLADEENIKTLLIINAKKKGKEFQLSMTPTTSLPSTASRSVTSTPKDSTEEAVAHILKQAKREMDAMSSPVPATSRAPSDFSSTPKRASPDRMRPLRHSAFKPYSETIVERTTSIPFDQEPQTEAIPLIKKNNHTSTVSPEGQVDKAIQNAISANDENAIRVQQAIQQAIRESNCVIDNQLYAMSPSFLAMAKPLKRVLPPLTSQHYEKYPELNTRHVTMEIKDQLNKYLIPQRLFGDHVLGLSQGSVSDILSHPKPWRKLTQKGREPFIRMQLWLEDEDAVDRLKTTYGKKGEGLDDGCHESVNNNGKSPLQLPGPVKAPGIEDIENSSCSSNNSTERNPHEQYTSLPELDTYDIARRVKKILYENNIGQRVFGEIVLGLTQGSVSDLLSKPKPWNSLSLKGKEPFVRMHIWLSDGEGIHKLKSIKMERKDRHDKLQKEYNETVKSLAEQKGLITQLEKDLMNVQALSTYYRGEGEGQAQAVMSSELVADAVRESAVLARPMVEATPNTSESLLPIISSQRERFRARNQELEAENHHQSQQIQVLQNDVDSLRSDNVKLYEKIKFLQSYPSRNSNRPDDGTESRYSSQYEEKLDPFSSFGKKERQRKYMNLSPHDKATLSMGRFILSNKIARTITFFYTIFLHCLVFLVLYKLAHTAACKRDMFSDCAQRFAEHMKEFHDEFPDA